MNDKETVAETTGLSTIIHTDDIEVTRHAELSGLIASIDALTKMTQALLESNALLAEAMAAEDEGDPLSTLDPPAIS